MLGSGLCPAPYVVQGLSLPHQGGGNFFLNLIMVALSPRGRGQGEGQFSKFFTASPFVKRRCERIQAENEIGFPRCSGDGEIRAAKIGGTRKPVQKGFLGFRKGARATCGNVM